jgi:hypothetical protein
MNGWMDGWMDGTPFEFVVGTGSTINIEEAKVQLPST